MNAAICLPLEGEETLEDTSDSDICGRFDVTSGSREVAMMRDAARKLKDCRTWKDPVNCQMPLEGVCRCGRAREGEETRKNGQRGWMIIGRSAEEMKV